MSCRRYINRAQIRE